MTERCCVTGCNLLAREQHHVLPVEYGGAMEGTKVPLCENHHGEVHRLFNQVLAKKLNPASIENAVMRTLVEKIGEQYEQYLITGVAEDARRRVVLYCSKELQDKVHFLRNHHGFSSIEKLLTKLIEDDFIKATGGQVIVQPQTRRAN